MSIPLPWGRSDLRSSNGNAHAARRSAAQSRNDGYLPMLSHYLFQTGRYVDNDDEDGDEHLQHPFVSGPWVARRKRAAVLFPLVVIGLLSVALLIVRRPLLPPHGSLLAELRHNLKDADIRNLLRLLEQEKSRLARVLPKGVDDSSVAMWTSPFHTSSGYSLGAALTRSYFGLQPTFEVGVTGGSSSAGTFSWPTLLESYLRHGLNITSAHVRNAAHGATSQQITSSCLSQLLGVRQRPNHHWEKRSSSLDLVLWEFATNDEYDSVMRPEWEGGGPEARRRAAEMWLRSALELDPLSIGFVHLWDLDIRGWQWDSPWIPDKPWVPTNEVMRKYAHYIDAFSVNVVRLLREDAEMITSKEAMLRDEVHPTAATYRIITDLVAYRMVTSWSKFLEATLEGQAKPLETPPSDALDRVLPLYDGSQVLAELSSSRTLRPLSFYTAPPQFGSYAPMSLICRNATGDNHLYTVGDIIERECDDWSGITLGHADPERADRQFFLRPPLCTSPERMRIQIAGGVDARYLGIGCGLFRPCNLSIEADGTLIDHNVTLEPSIFSEFYSFMHHWPAHDHINLHSISICAQVDGQTVERVVVHHMPIENAWDGLSL